MDSSDGDESFADEADETPLSLAPLEITIDGTVYRHKPRRSRHLHGAAYDAAVAAWHAADTAPWREAMRQAMRAQCKARRARTRTRPADDAARRVQQRRDDPAQQQVDRGTCTPIRIHVQLVKWKAWGSTQQVWS